MKLVKATQKDSQRISVFFSQHHLQGHLDIKFFRKKDFFRQYQIQSDDFVTYILLNKEEKIEALVSIIFRDAYLNGKKELVGWATDLRVSNSREAVLNWAKYFLPALSEERNKRGCRYLFSLLFKKQRQAYNAFIRPRQLRRILASYYPFRRLKQVTLHGLMPLRSHPLSSIKLRYAEKRDFPHLISYLIKKRKQLPIYYSIDPDIIQTDIKRWEGLDVENFILAIDNEGNIIGCTAPWSSRRIQELTVKGLSSRAKKVFKTFYLMSFFKMTRPIISSEDKTLHFSYLTHLFADNSDIFYSLLYHAWKTIDPKEFLVYTHFENNLLTTPPQSFIHTTMDALIYCILDFNEDVPDFLKPHLLNEPPEFELAFW